MKPETDIAQEAYRQSLRENHQLRGGLVRAALRHRRWIWTTRLFRWSHGRFGRPMGPPRKAA